MSRLRRSSTIAFIMVALAAIVFLLIAENIPEEQTDSVLSSETDPNAVARVRLTVDSIDAPRAIMKIRLSVTPGPKPLPPEGVTVLTDFENVAPLRLLPGSAPQELATEVPFERGEIAAYPFDEYGLHLRIDVVEGAVAGGVRGDAKAVVFDATAIDSSAGFTIESRDRGDADDALSVNIDVTRNVPIIIWVCVMLVIYWLLAFSVMTVTALVVLGLREWESRHLAWLGAMLFAFATFRTAAPGSPPVGTFLDYAGFFWAEMLVSLSLVALVVFYLLGLKDPERTDPPATEPPPPGESTA